MGSNEKGSGSKIIRVAPPKPEQLDLFIVDIADVSIKDARHTMTAPFLSLSKRPRFKPIEYTDRNGNEVKISGGAPHGIATIWDFDIMLWLFGQIRLMIERGEEPTRYIGFHPYDCLKGVKRHSGKSQYTQLEGALTRLWNTRIATNIDNDHPQGEGAGWLDNVKFHRHPESKRLMHIEVWVNEWIFHKAVDETKILTIHPDYFMLTGGIARFLYRTARKMAGRQKNGWVISMRRLFEQSGADDPKHFAQSVRQIADLSKDFPEYDVEVFRKADSRKSPEFVRFKPKAGVVKGTEDEKEPPTPLLPALFMPEEAPKRRSLELSDDAYDEAKVFCRRHDIDFFVMFGQWKEKQTELARKGGRTASNPDKAFLGYLKGVVTNRRKG
jgi:plasmid replication initiation protein